MLHDIGEQDGIAFLVMEYLEGETLASRLSRGPLPPDEVVRYGTEIADALDRAHRHGVIHRDLKPANVMLTRTGAKLLDFGLARPPVESIFSSETRAPGDTPITAEGVLVGTLQYMAPEQLEARAVDARTDIFALGALLYEMSHGRARVSRRQPGEHHRLDPEPPAAGALDASAAVATGRGPHRLARPGQGSRRSLADGPRRLPGAAIAGHHAHAAVEPPSPRRPAG